MAQELERALASFADPNTAWQKLNFAHWFRSETNREVEIVSGRSGARALIRIKPRATFSDAIALVRERLWLGSILSTNNTAGRTKKTPRALLNGLLHTACYAE